LTAAIIAVPAERAEEEEEKEEKENEKMKNERKAREVHLRFQNPSSLILHQQNPRIALW